MNSRRAITKDGIHQRRLGVWVPSPLFSDFKKLLKKYHMTMREGIIATVEFFLKNFGKN